MIKWAVVFLCIVGTFFLINSYIPGAWHTAFTLPIGQGVSVSWAAMVLGGVFILGARLRSK
jgi:hypothetical protein